LYEQNAKCLADNSAGRLTFRVQKEVLDRDLKSRNIYEAQRLYSFKKKGRKKMNNSNTEGLRTAIRPQLSDKLYTLAAEYAVPPDLLVNLAVKRLIDDVEFLRSLRAGKLK
jgi:hypothetical protein